MSSSSGKPTKILPYLTIIPSIFTLVSIIALQAGGLDSRKDFTAGNYDEGNYHFSLVKWRYTISPPNTTNEGKTFSESLFLNTACYTVDTPGNKSSAGGGSWQEDRSENTHCENLHGKSFPTSNSHSLDTTPDYVWSIRYASVKVKISQILYSITAALAVVLLPLPLLAHLLSSGASGNGRRTKIKIFAVVISALMFVLMLTASALLTHQMIKLRDEIQYVRSKTIKSVPDANGNLIDTVYITKLEYARIGQEVLALTWTAAVAAVFGALMWLRSWAGESREWESVRLLDE